MSKLKDKTPVDAYFYASDYHNVDLDCDMVEWKCPVCRKKHDEELPEVELELFECECGCKVEYVFGTLQTYNAEERRLK